MKALDTVSTQRKTTQKERHSLSGSVSTFSRGSQARGEAEIVGAATGQTSAEAGVWHVRARADSCCVHMGLQLFVQGSSSNVHYKSGKWS